MENIPIKTAKTITECLTCFDFDKVTKILQMLDVHVDSDERGEDVLIGVQELKDKADNLIWALIDTWDENDRPEYYEVDQFFLKATINQGNVSLSFVPEEWRTDC